MKTIYRKFIFLVVLTILAIFFSLPSFIKHLPDGLSKILASDGMRLGLDLQGGMSLILKVNLPQAVQTRLELNITDLRQNLKERGITLGPTESRGSNHVHLQLLNPSDLETLQKILAREYPNLVLLSASQTRQAASVDLGLNAKAVRDIEDNSVDQSVEIIRNRIDQFGVSEPVLLQQGKDEIVVQLPGIKDPQRAIQLIGRTAQLEFKLVDSQADIDLRALIAEKIDSGRLKENFSHKALNLALKGLIPAGDEAYMEKRVAPETGRTAMAPVLLKKRTLMTGEMLKTAKVEITGPYSEPSVALTLNQRGALIFKRITGEYVGRQLAIILDNIVQSAPVIREQISGGNAQITGSFTTEEAHDLAIVLRAGALPASVDIVQNLTVGPTLGLDSIHKGVASAVLGGVLVILFMFVYYRLSGLIADMALLLNLIFMMAALSLFRATLTLPGIAGIVLTIGMAVDSNVLIFERMREEFALNKPFRSAVEGGYDKALWTIVDSHITTLITAFALFLFGTGPIKGFAVTLSIGVIFNLFTALFGTRVVYDYLNFKRRIKSIRFLQIIKDSHIDFIKLRKAAFLFSGMLVLLGLFAFVQIQRGRANLGVDFTGGAMMQFKAKKPFGLAEIRAALARHHLTDYELQNVPEQNMLIVRIKKAERSVGDVADRVAAVLHQELPEKGFVVESKAEIGSSVSHDLKKAALIAVAISLAGIIFYLAWRFDFRFGVAAAVATFHDVLTVLGIFYLLNKEITLLLVTALLTLAGYSLTDTVVVFDRIRENLLKKGKPELGQIINQSINEVLSRTLITSGTVLMVLIALLLMGGILLRDFSLALTIGVVVGTYSSIFVASPIVYVWPTAMKIRGKGIVHKKH
ncbi:MAG: protein translocase subunit SecD [Desulfobacterales bacterium]|nr:protein translocase subunit SecD [Desulfobacterales bacterium]